MCGLTLNSNPSMPGHRSKKWIGLFRKKHKRSNREQISDDEVMLHKVFTIKIYIYC